MSYIFKVANSFGVKVTWFEKYGYHQYNLHFHSKPSVTHFLPNKSRRPQCQSITRESSVTRRTSFNIANVSAWPTAFYPHRKRVSCPLDVWPQNGGKKEKKVWKRGKKKEYPLDVKPKAARAYLTKRRNRPVTLRGGMIQKTLRATIAVKTPKKPFITIIIIITAFIGRFSRTYTCPRITTTNTRKKKLHLTLMYELHFPEKYQDLLPPNISRKNDLRCFY